jgi:hypothetical protein
MKLFSTALSASIGRCQIVLCLLPILLGINGTAATVGSPETWDSGTVANWINYDAVNERSATLATENGGITITFPKQSVKTPPEEYVFEAGTNASGGKFTGDYVSGGVTGMCFRLYCDRPVEVSALLYNADTKRLWRYRIPAVRTGEWMVVQVPLTPQGMDNQNGVSEWGSLDEDLRHVTWVGVSIERNSSMSIQSYRLDDFVLQGVPEFGSWMAQFPRPPEYGVGTCVALSEGDLDGDGVCNYNEWIAGTSAGDKTDAFRIAINTARSAGLEASGAGMALKWPSAANRKYCVWRSTNLADGFVKMGTVEIEATPPENVIVDTTATNNGAYFYKVDVRRVDL